jgi:hypothetical protein
MEDTRSLGEIALLLGYSDLSAFIRAYKNGSERCQADVKPQLLSRLNLERA